MSNLSGILSLQEAMSTNFTTLASLNPNQLHLGNITEIPSKVNNTHPKFTQPLFYNGGKLVLRSPAVHLSKLQVDSHKLGQQVKVPVTPWLRQQLLLIDDFASRNAVIPPKLLQSWPDNKENYYRPFYQGNSINILIGKFCAFSEGLDLENSHLYPEVSRCSGLYTFAIEVYGIYIGPHSNGSLISCACRVIEIHCQPDTDKFEETIESFVAPAPVKKHRKRKGNATA